ncbi:MAG: hypothetical protein H7246_17590 [Phycisphaerae bacterium]|nr:hypothetical protein [Saprospiraceae bacterium]
MQEIWFGLSTAAQYCAAASLLLLLLRFRRLSPPFKVLIWVLVNELITESLASWLFNQKINNMPLLHLYTLVSFWILSYFFRILFRKKPFVRRYFWAYLGLITALLCANSYWFEPIHGFNSNAKTLVQCLIIGYVVYYLFDAFGEIDLLQPNELAISLVNIAILIYNAGSLFIFMFAKILNQGLLSPEAQSGLWMVNSLLYLVFQLLLLTAIWIQAFKAKKSFS